MSARVLIVFCLVSLFTSAVVGETLQAQTTSQNSPLIDCVSRKLRVLGSSSGGAPRNVALGKDLARQIRAAKFRLKASRAQSEKVRRRLQRRYRELLSLKQALKTCESTSIAPPIEESTPPTSPVIGANECSDGLDNDGDGLIDGQDNGSVAGAALGCLGPNFQESGDPVDGYTVFTPHATTRIIYVSDSVGDDSFDGLSPYPVTGTLHGPKKTLAEGARLMTARRGNPDWMLLNRCDDFVNQHIGGFHSLPDGTRYGGDFSGSEALNAPMLFGAYGNCSRRPRIMPRASSGMGLYLNNHDTNLVVTGIEFYDDRKDPSSHQFTPSAFAKGIVITRGSRHILLEDNAFRFFSMNIVLESVLEEGCPQVLIEPFDCPVGSVVEDVTIRRNVIADAYSLASVSHAQGIFSEGVRGLVIEENILDHNGWNETPSIAEGARATIYNHGMYLSKSFANDTIVRGNIVANSSATGIQLRVGGVIEGNLVLRNPLGITVGHAQTPMGMPLSASVLDNVVLESRDIHNEPRGYGIAVGKAFGLTVRKNLVAHQRFGTMNIYGIRVDEPSSTSLNVSVTDNVVYDWAKDATGAALSFGGIQNGLYLQRNAISQPFGGVAMEIQTPQTPNAMEANRFFSIGAVHWGDIFDAARPFRYGTSPLTPGAFSETITDRTSTFGPIVFPEPTRDVGAYMETLGMGASHNSFMQAARNLSRLNYQPQFTASEVNRYLRYGFGMNN